MSDPLGLIGGAGGASPLRPQQKLPGGGQPTDPDAPSFKDLLMENIQQVNKLQQDASTATEDVLAGRSDDVEGVLLATEKADQAFRMLLAVRNKMMEAYNEVREIRV